MSDVVCDFLVPLDSFETKATFLLKPQRVVQFIQGNMKVLGIPISACLIIGHRSEVLLIGGNYNRTMLFPCTRQQESICNWVTFCGINSSTQ